MASRKTPPPKRDSFFPPSENAVYRDLLLFEERLKTNASLLKKRKHRYQLFLTQLLAIIVFLAFEVILETHLLDMPCNYALQKAFPENFAGGGGHAVELHPFVAKGLLFVSITTLLLFFASGLYGERIAYANRYVPHANRALRNFNMYLNVRHRPLRSRLFNNPFTYLFNRGKSEETSPHRTPSPDGRRRRGTSVPIPPIPPTNNPRGELIFSSRVDRNFRESYERYRAAFERKRELREQYALAQTWRGWRVWPWNWMGRGLPQPASYAREHGAMSSMRGRGLGSDSESNSSTPNSSRRASPVPGSIGRTRGSGLGSGSRSSSPPSGIPPRRLTPDGVKSESFSFLLSNEDSFG